MEIIAAPLYNGRQGNSHDNPLLRTAIQMGQKYALKYQRIKKRQNTSPGKVARDKNPTCWGWGWALVFASSQRGFWVAESRDILLVEFSGFPGDSDGKESICNARDSGSTPGSGRRPGKGHGYPLQCSCLENSLDRGAWRATIHGIAKSWTQLRD